MMETFDYLQNSKKLKAIDKLGQETIYNIWQNKWPCYFMLLKTTSKS